MRLPLACAVLLVTSLGCAAERVRGAPVRAPEAKRPEILGVYRMNQRPTMQPGTLEVGTPTELKGCTGNPKAIAMVPPKGVLLRFEAPVPTDLKVVLGTALGGQVVASPEDLADEDRLADRGLPYYYENAQLTRTVPTGQVAPRELYLAPGRAAPDGRFDVSLRTTSLDPLAQGEGRESQQMVVSIVPKCPDYALELTPTRTTLQAGASIRWKVRFEPSGSSVGDLVLELSVGPLPKGVTAMLHDTEFQGSDWSTPRETRLDLFTTAEAAPGDVKIVLKGKLGALVRTNTETLTVEAAPVRN